MTAVFGDVEIDITPRIYGASELGVLSLTAPGDAHPRVVYVGGELFVGLDRLTGGAITQGDAAQAAAPFDDTVAAALPQQTTFETRDGLATVTDETQAAAVLRRRLKGEVVTQEESGMSAREWREFEGDWG